MSSYNLYSLAIRSYFDTFFKIDIRVVFLLSFCTALMNAIASSITDSFAEADSKKSEQTTKESSIHSLSDQEKFRIERLASALNKVEEKDAEQSLHPDRAYSRIEGSNHDATTTISPSSTISNVSYIIRAKATIPETIITVVNDLQGLDDALFKLLFKNFVFGGEFDFPSEANALPLFRFHVNTGIVSNYFDTNSLLWESLLLKEWQINFNGMRAPQKRFSSSRMSTSFDIDSHPCYLSFSEQFLVSIGAATKMWGVYSSASQKAADLGTSIEKGVRSNSSSTQKDSLALSARKSLAACAARSLITTMPCEYAGSFETFCYFVLHTVPPFICRYLSPSLSTFPHSPNHSLCAFYGYPLLQMV